MSASQGQGKNERFEQAHDDMLGTIMTGIAGANQWLVQNVRDTLYPLQFLRDNSSDFYCFHAQSPHRRKQGANIDSIHLHYLLDGAGYTAGNTLVFDVYWTWVIPDTVFPALSGRNSALGVSVVLNPTSNLPPRYTGIFSLVTNIAPPSPEGYGTGLIVRIVRQNGTHNDNIGVWRSDAHVQKDRNGSFYEFTD